MRSRNGLAFPLLTLLSNNTTLTFAQYVITVTEYVNDNPFCTSRSGVGASGINSDGPFASESGLGSLGSNEVGSGAGSATKGSLSVPPIDTSSGRYDALGYLAAPADGNLLGGPIYTSPLMTVELCGTDCQGYTYMALENGDECNCGSSAPSGTSYSSAPSRKRGQPTGVDCTPCIGNSGECCGAPGGYAIVYRLTPYVEAASVVAYSSTNELGSVVEASSTAYSPISSPSIVAYTTTGLDGLHTLGPTNSYATTSTRKFFTSSTSVPLASPSTQSGAESGGHSGPKPNTGLGGAIPGISIDFGGSSPSSLTSSSSTVFGIGGVTGSGSTLATSIPGPEIVLGAGHPATASGAATTASVVQTAAPAVAGNGGNGDISPTVNGSNSIATGTAASEDNAGSAGMGGGTATANTGGTPAGNDGGGPEPTGTTAPSCAKSSSYAGNNTKYIDYFGFTYDIRCNLDLRSTPTDYDAHADSFEDCLEYCSLLTGCIAVSYQDPPDTPRDISNCYPKWSFGGYQTTLVDGLYSGVNVNGASPGTLENQNLCTTDNQQGTSYAGITYYDDFGTAWTIGCDTSLAISNAAALFPTVTDTLASCVDYCSIYASCNMINWTGTHTNGTLNDPNCFSASSIGIAGAPGSTPRSGYAKVYS